MVKRVKTTLTARRKVRTTVGLPVKDYDILARLAERQKVSMGWVIRDAIEKYLEGQAPLIPRD